MKKLYAGPWVGELGWECMAWNGYLRAIAKDYDEITICGPTGHDGLYADFMTNYVSYDAPTVKANMWMNSPEIMTDAEMYFQAWFGVHEFGDITRINPQTVWGDLVRLPKRDLVTALKPQKFIRLGSEGSRKGFDIVYHARNRDDWDSGFRNWQQIDCDRVLRSFVDAGFRIACIGKKDMANYVSGTTDLRDISLSSLADVLANSKVLVGPISGPIHFGALCGIDHVTWAVKTEHEQRIRSKWNPFNPRIECITADDKVWKERIPWTPDVKQIATAIKGILDGKTKIPVRGITNLSYA